MKKTRLSTLALAGALALGAALPARAADSPPLDAAIDIKLTKAKAEEIFKTFGQILSAEAEVDPALAGRILTIYLEGVRVRTALTAACDGLGCDWSFADGKPRRLTVKATGPQAAKAPEKADGKRPGIDEKIDIKVTRAKIAEVFRTAGEILSVGLDLDPKVSGEIDLDLAGVPVSELLNRLCAAASCRWTLSDGKKPTLTVTSVR
jgi:hypothetical protein